MPGLRSWQEGMTGFGEDGLQQVKLANIVLEDTPQFLSEPLLLCRSTAPFHSTGGEDGSWVFLGPGTHDFTTFFNALSVRRWREYTVAKEFFLHLEYRGGAFTLRQTRADLFSWDAESVGGVSQDFAASDAWQVADLAMRSDQDDVIEGFMLDVPKDEPVYLRGCYYFTHVDEGDLRPVELALCTTTFKKESYIERNIALVKGDILAGDDPIAAHFTQHVVDNGRTLDVHALEAERVHVYPNANVGGAGGYARGMLAAMDQVPKATHVLLMDDDVVISPESIRRTFNLLSILNEEHRDWFVSGAMMDLFEPDLRWEDTGFVTPDGDCVPLKVNASMGQLHGVVTNELPTPLPAKVDQQLLDTQSYAGWWYCVIPMSAIEKHGLPLPVFVRYDDIEYGIRCQARFITMNGICLWHPSFARRYNAAVERYQVVRNSFIGRFAMGMAPRADFEMKLYHLVQLELKKFNYTNANLALDGFEDFLKGPSFIEEPGATERAFMEANRRAERLLPYDELQRQAQSEGIDLSGITRTDTPKDRTPPELRSLGQRLVDFASFNGQRIDLGYVKRGAVAYIDVAGWLYPSSEIRRKDTIVAVDLENRRGVIRHMDRRRFRETWGRYKRAMSYYRAHKDRLLKEYSAEADRLTSLGFWKSYLGMG